MAELGADIKDELAELGADIKDELAVLLLCLANDEVKKVFKDEAAAAKVVIDTYTKSIGSKDATIQSLARKVAVAQYRNLDNKGVWWQVAKEWNIWSSGWEDSNGCIDTSKKYEKNKLTYLELVVEKDDLCLLEEQKNKFSKPRTSLESILNRDNSGKWVKRYWMLSRSYAHTLMYDSVVWRNGVTVVPSSGEETTISTNETKEFRYKPPYQTQLKTWSGSYSITNTFEEMGTECSYPNDPAKYPCREIKRKDASTFFDVNKAGNLILDNNVLTISGQTISTSSDNTFYIATEVQGVPQPDKLGIAIL